MRSLNWRQRLAQKWMFKTDRTALPEWVERYRRLDNFLNGLVFNWPCWLLWAHYAIPDHCMIPAHDYCAWCHKSMPNQGERQ